MKLTVVGDLLLDRDLEGTSTRVSPDGEVPVIDVARRSVRPGGAGLAAALLHADGIDVELVTAMNDDAGGRTLRRLLTGIDVVSCNAGVPTPSKTRISISGAPFGRLDEHCGPPPVPTATDRAREAIERADAILVADYGRALTRDPGIRESLASAASRVPVVWDPHPRGAAPVAGVELMTPNLSEATSAAGLEERVENAEASALHLLDQAGSRGVVVTLGHLGALLAEPHRSAVRMHGEALHGADPCGAGDRFAATCAVLLAQGHERRAAVQGGIDAAGAYLAAGGVQHYSRTITQEEGTL